MSTTSTGREAESRVCAELVQRGHKILSQNWRTRWCEIDIVSTSKGCVYFTEVKFRRSTTWGTGLAYITDKKLQQMQFAAELWLSQHSWKGEACLMAAEVDDKFTIYLIEL